MLDDENSIHCYGPCEKWFIIDCSKITHAKCAKFTGDNNLTCTCDRIDYNKNGNYRNFEGGSSLMILINHVPKLTGKMNKLISMVDYLKEEDISPIPNDIRLKFENVFSRTSTGTIQKKNLHL